MLGGPLRVIISAPIQAEHFHRASHSLGIFHVSLASALSTAAERYRSNFLLSWTQFLCSSLGWNFLHNCLPERCSFTVQLIRITQSSDLVPSHPQSTLHFSYLILTGSAAVLITLAYPRLYGCRSSRQVLAEHGCRRHVVAPSFGISYRRENSSLSRSLSSYHWRREPHTPAIQSTSTCLSSVTNDQSLRMPEGRGCCWVCN